MPNNARPQSVYELGLRPGAIVWKPANTALHSARTYDQFAVQVLVSEIAVGELEQAASKIEEGRLLAMVPEREATYGSDQDTSFIRRFASHNARRPSLEFVAIKFAAIVVPKCVYTPHNSAYNFPKVDTEGVSHEHIDPLEAADLMREAQEHAPSNPVFTLDIPTPK